MPFISLILVLSLATSAVSCVTRNSEPQSESTGPHDVTWLRAFDFARAEAKVAEMREDGRPVLLFSDVSRDKLGGMGTVLRDLESFAEGAGIPLKWVFADDFRTKWQGPGLFRFVWVEPQDIEKILDEVRPQAVHVVSEGPLGLAAMRTLRDKKTPYTTAYHNNIPKIGEAIRVPFVVSQTFVRFIHSGSSGVLSPSGSMTDQLLSLGIKKEQIRYWTHGVDRKLFRPKELESFTETGKKWHEVVEAKKRGRLVVGFVGRFSVERKIDELVALDVDALKLMVGDGPEMAAVRRRVEEDEGLRDSVILTGRASGEELVDLYNLMDVLMVDARPDSFGLVHLEAAACGTPVAGLDGTVSELILSENMGYTAPSLEEAIQGALGLDPALVRAETEMYDLQVPGLLWAYYLERLPQQAAR